MGCGASVFQEIKLHFNFFLRLWTMQTLSKNYLTWSLPNRAHRLCESGPLPPERWLYTKAVIKRRVSPGVHSSTSLPLRNPLMVCADCPSTDWLAVVCQESFLHASSISLVWSEVSLIPEREKRINGPPLQRSLVGFQLLSSSDKIGPLPIGPFLLKSILITLFIFKST